MQLSLLRALTLGLNQSSGAQCSDFWLRQLHHLLYIRVSLLSPEAILGKTPVRQHGYCRCLPICIYHKWLLSLLLHHHHHYNMVINIVISTILFYSCRVLQLLSPNYCCYDVLAAVSVTIAGWYYCFLSDVH